jgi:hypothetical protein
MEASGAFSMIFDGLHRSNYCFLPWKNTRAVGNVRAVQTYSPTLYSTSVLEENYGEFAFVIM